MLGLGLDQNIWIFLRWVGHSIFNFEIRISFFLSLENLACETVLNLSAWLKICTSNRPFANERRSCWPIACIYFMKNLLWASLSHIYIWNSKLKQARDATCEQTLCNHKTECDACVFFSSTVPRWERKSWVSAQTRCADVKPLWESEREKTRHRWITHAVIKRLI